MKRKANKPTAEARQEILEFLRAHPKSTVVEIHQGTDLNETAIRKNVVPMEADGLLARQKRHATHEGDLWWAIEEEQ